MAGRGVSENFAKCHRNSQQVFINREPIQGRVELINNVRLLSDSGDTSIWVLVVFTIDRFSAICFPLRKRDWWTPRRAKYYALGAFMVAVSKNLAVFWTRGAEHVAINDTVTVLVSNCGRPTAAYRYVTASNSDRQTSLIFLTTVTRRTAAGNGIKRSRF